MTDFKVIDVAETPYFYVERTTSMAEVAAAMGSAFQEVWAFMERHGVPPAGGALAVYHEYPADGMTFRAGFTVRKRDMGAANDPVKADLTPGGRVLHFTHRGSYAGLPGAYNAMMGHMETEGLAFAPPTWEIYMNSPDEVHEEQLLTECYQALAE